jgi:hypothetical protein
MTDVKIRIEISSAEGMAFSEFEIDRELVDVMANNRMVEEFMTDESKIYVTITILEWIKLINSTVVSRG